VMTQAKATALAIDAGRTLIFDRQRVVEMANAAGIAIEAAPHDPEGGNGQ
jgi:DUF1009 family protein